MKTFPLKLFALSFGLMALVNQPANCKGQGQDYYTSTIAEPTSAGRTGHTEFYLLGQYWHAEDAVAHNMQVDLAPGPNPPMATGDIKFHADDTGFWGFGIGYNFSEHLNINGEFTFGYPNYTVTFQNATLSAQGFVQSGKFDIEYNVLSSRFTPFVSAGLGYLYLDTGVPSGPPGYYCWWDDWWGQTCVGTTPTYTQTYFTMNAQVGVRWDVNDRFFMKAYGTANWIDLASSAGRLDSVQASVALGWKF